MGWFTPLRGNIPKGSKVYLGLKLASSKWVGGERGISDEPGEKLNLRRKGKRGGSSSEKRDKTL